ncbi:hypothetical protein [Heyndrickxia oleronia]|uniref:hypothetical protein n=1 Tax=Heyndrickxia oleronia TaxID=38875 RepID=UPI001C0F3726|nr:hypothetical protein [Heyndrickxia oleronia]MBU5214362.1 hypothetical protein [Heyndrickxia oleronia]
MKVTVKSIPVYHNGDRYLKGETLNINEKHFNDSLFVIIEESNDDIDLYELTADELKKVNKDVIKSFLNKEGIEFDSNANKEALIKIVLGEDEEDQNPDNLNDEDHQGDDMNEQSQ